MDIKSIEEQELELLEISHWNRMLIFEPSAEFLQAAGQLALDKRCEAFNLDDIENLTGVFDNEKKFTCILAGQSIDQVDNPAGLLFTLKSYLATMGILIVSSKKYTAGQLIQSFSEAGFKDICVVEAQNDMYIVRGALYKLVTMQLRQQYTAEVRHDLMRLVRRIEADIEIPVTCHKVWKLCDKNKISREYLVRFVENTTIEPKRILNILAANAVAEGSYGRK